MKGGSVEFKFTGDTSDVEKKASGLGDKLNTITKAGLSGLVSAGTIATTILTKVTKEAVKSQGELEQQIGGTEAVFGKLANVVQNDASKAFDKMGISANDYMQYMNKMGSLMKGSGIDTQKAMNLSSQAMQRAADVASVMGISVDDAMTAISGAAKGNFTMMDNLGVAMNATSLNAYALQKGLKKTYNQMSQGEKVELAMQMFLEKSSHATGNYAKENKTFAGSLTTLKASLQNLLSGAGTVDQVISAISNFGNILVQNLVKILPQVVQGLVNLINGLLPLLPSLIQTLLPPLIDGIMQLTIGIIDALPDIIMMIADMLPTMIPQIVDAIMLIIPALVKMTPKFLEAGVKLIGGLVTGVGRAIGSALSKIGSWALKIFNKIADVLGLNKVMEIGKNLVKGLWNGINNATQWVLDKIKGFGKSVLKGIKKIFGISSPSKEFEIIGKYNVMGLEKGMKKESLKLEDSFDSMFSLNPNLYGTASTNLSPQVNVINNISMKQDNLGQIVKDIKTFSGGAKNDYSYGMGA